MLAVGPGGGCRCGQRGRPAPAARGRDAGALPALPAAPALRAHHREAVQALAAGRKAAGEAAVRRLKDDLRSLEAQARLACLGPGRRPREIGPENARACALRAAIVAASDHLAHRLAPGDAAAEQLDRLGWLARRLGGPPWSLLDAPLLPPPHAVSAPERPLEAADPPAAVPLGRCRAGPGRPLLRASDGAVAFHLGTLGGEPALAWVRRCDAAAPPCDGDGLFVQTLAPDGRERGARQRLAVDVSRLDAGSPFRLLDAGAAGAAILFARDGDPWIAPLGAAGRPPGPARPLLASGDPLGRHQGTLAPRPAWLSRSADPPLLELRVFSGGAALPRVRLQLAGASPDPREDLFGAPALLGVPEGLLVAHTTLGFLQILRLDAAARPLGPRWRVPWPSGRLVDPRCVLLAAGARGRYVLALGAAGERAFGLLVGLDPAGRPLRLPVAVPLPFALPPGCPLALVPSRGRLVVVGPGRSPTPRRPGPLLAVELGPDGRRAGPVLRLGVPEAFAGAVGTAEGALVVFRAASGAPGPPRRPARGRAPGKAPAAAPEPEDPAAPGEVLAAPVRCR